ncbi:ZP domain-containing protein-like [Dendronephthya gigantea]|uniref:ZP domain-containing protein-like n=1 Tax=Dendronephthya gigantea TaxID=151771 RepID=UPI00106CAE90|nr:ZP domain-containing protein-like [Dendronephthya gigantea]
MASRLSFGFLLCTLGMLVNHVNAHEQENWKRKFVVEQSWTKFEHADGLEEVEHDSKNEFFAFLEKPVKESRVKRQTLDDSGSGSTSDEYITQCHEKLDLGFILDSSSSIGRTNYGKMKSFVKDLTSHFVISQSYTRVSVISYASSSSLNFPFSRVFASRQDLHSAIDNIPYTGGGTNTASAMAQALSEMFHSMNGARLSDAKKVLIVLTDGQSSGSVDLPAQQLKNIRVVIFSIGVGFGIDQSEQETMASAPVDDHVYMLNNFNEFSTLARKMSATTCDAISYLVICEKDNIEVIIGRHEVSNIDLNNIHLADSSCKASYNASHVFITTALNECGTTYSETDQQMFYNNTLTATVLIPLGSVITREKSFAFNFKCAYSRLISVSGLKFEPPKPEIVIKQSSFGNFTVNLGSYADDGFLSSSSEDYPAFKSFSDRINIQYYVDTQDSDIVVRAETCRATPSSKPYDTPQYEFISNGCDKDSTITHFTSGLQKSHRFSIQVFRFVTNDTFVYIHCDLRLCNRNIHGSICAKRTSCSERRKRNAPIFDVADRSYQLSIGPIVYREEKTRKQTEEKDEDKNQENVTESGSSLNTIMIVMLVCAGVIVVLLSLTVVVLVRRRGRGNSTTSVEKVGMECSAGKVEELDISNVAGK